MVMDLFESLLEEFSKTAEIPDLKPDSNNSCLIVMPNEGPKIQMEIDSTGNYFVMGTGLGFLPMGRYREMIFKEALRANGLPYPRVGDFAFSKKTENLIMFAKLPVKDLNGTKIASTFSAFVEKATHWQDAISRGEVPSINGAFSTRKGGAGMFGL